jgi:predicted dehydrogenase
MRVGIIGTGWGRTHVGTFRGCGHAVEVLVGRDADRTRTIAAQEGVAVGTTDLAALDAMDVVVIATPPATHAALVERFSDKLLVCEKPLLGRPPTDDDVALIRRPTLRLAVNYAFGFLDTAKRLQGLVAADALGVVEHIHLAVAVRLGDITDPRHWLLEVGSHPLAFIQHLFGSFAPVRVAEHSPETLIVDSDNGVQQLRVRIEPASEPGIVYDLRLQGAAGRVELRGATPEGGQWAYEGLQHDGATVSEPERSTHEDVWYAANCRCIATSLDVLTGAIAPSHARAVGVTSGADALELERMLAPVHGR